MHKQVMLIFKKNVKAALKSYSSENPNYPILKKLVTAFEKAKKLKPAYLEKDNLGIAIFLSSQNPELDIFPARYTFEHERINFSALRNKNTKKPSDDMREYVKTYIEDFNHLGNTTIFKKLIYNAPETEGTLTSNTTEQIVKEPYATTFVRGDDTWMYAMSTGNQGIILYAFKMTVSGENLMDISVDSNHK
ncbi:hypothetical protein [Pedobacter sp. Leaf250]|uniref:hypothetical protein n=1 Tax=Pedobacter sp. Leaf250 TaxID=2876559 RepID=UPI001E5DF8C1|nr:hypothetical protein [Pedobacter sp. Leaf250]